MCFFVIALYIRWDGDFEAGIQVIRRDLKRVRKSMETYFKHKLQYARRKRSLKIINEQCGVEDEDNIFLEMLQLNPDDEEPKTRFYASFYRYETREDIEIRLNGGSVLCGFYTTGMPGYVFVAFGKGRQETEFVTIKYDKFAHDGANPLQCNGLHFRSMTLCDESWSCTKAEFREVCDGKRGDGYCLLLPYVKLAEDGSTEAGATQYTIVTDNWETLSTKGMISLPEYSRVLWSEYLDQAQR